MAYNSKYSIELWTKNGSLLADLSGKAGDIVITKARNQPDDISFSLDLDAFEKYCRDINIDPKNVLVVNSTEVRVRRLGNYVSGGQLVAKSTRINPNKLVIDCRAKGFLWLFSQRITGTSYSGGVNQAVSQVYTAAASNAKSRNNLAWTLIEQTQALINGSFGITRGTQGGTSTLYDKTYNRTNILDALQAITNLQTAPIDIEITPEKVFNTYTTQGSNRPDIVFNYPGNIKSMDIPDDGTDVKNEVIGRSQVNSSGFQFEFYGENISSQTTYQLRQETINTDSVNNLNNGLTDATGAVLAAKNLPLKLPTLTVDGNKPPYITDYGIGDYISVGVTGYALLSDIAGMYRLEKFVLRVDESENEDIDLSISNGTTNANTTSGLYDNALVGELQSLRRDINGINTGTVA